jgi:phosphoribosylaminoimidazolecarboxamide formyltransferase/IMP cyclohydrolase
MRFRRLLVQSESFLKIRRALITVSDKAGVVELAQALVKSGAEIVATGRTGQILKEAGIEIVPIEKVSGSPEAFQGRMKTLSFPVCSGILYRRGDPSDEMDLQKLGILPIDCVVVNFYPFEQAAARERISQKELPKELPKELIEEIDIGGPTLVRAGAKNAPQVLVLTSPDQYAEVISSLATSDEGVKHETVNRCAREAWERIDQYDQAIAARMGTRASRVLRYGENPHQTGRIEFDPNGPIAWPASVEAQLTSSELSYNNILDFSAAYALASDLKSLHSTAVVIVKHNNPCGVAVIPLSGCSLAQAQQEALSRAWEGDPVSAFGGVVIFTDAIQESVASWLAERFVELVGAPELSKQSRSMQILSGKRKNLKAVAIRRFGEVPEQTVVSVPGGKLFQTSDTDVDEEIRSVTKTAFPRELEQLSRFGISVCRALKSNAIALVREIPGTPGALQLVGAGQGQPNRIEALKALAVPRARNVLETSGGSMCDCIMISDAFFPFRDTVDTANEFGIRYIVQPGGSIKDKESIGACDEHGIAMAFTGIRHFRH